MSIELKPCPFCGADPHDARHIEYGRWAVTCRCGASGVGANTGPNATDAAKIKAYQDARTAWNTRTAIQQAEAQQPAIPEGWVPCIVTYEGQHPEEVAYGPQRMMERLKKWLDRYFEMKVVQQPATPASVQADNSEHLRVIASLGDALRRLSFAAQTTGGTNGPDAELQSAIGQAEQALSLGGIWQAMSATGEPVKAAPYNPTEEMRRAMKRIDPALSSEQCRALWSAAWSAAPSTHQAPSVPDDVVRDAERYRWLRDHDHWPAPFSSSQEPEPVRGRDLDAAIDAAMLAAKERP